ncbi:MAG: hypothetical protein AAB037_01285, partial [Chloroflexota bacterium]
PEEQIPIRVYLVENDGKRIQLATKLVEFSIEGASGKATRESGRGIARVFDDGDLKPGNLLVSYGGLSASIPFSLIPLNAEDVRAIEGLNQQLELATDRYQKSKVALDTAQIAFAREHQRLGSGASQNRTVQESFTFNASFGQLKPPGTPRTITLAEMRRPLGTQGFEVITAENAFFKLLDGSATFTLVKRDQRLSGDGSLVPCKDVFYQGDCYAIHMKGRASLQQPTRPGVVDPKVQIHQRIAGQTIDVLSASYASGSEPGQTQVVYMLHPPTWCGSIFNPGGTIGFTPHCGKPEGPIISNITDGQVIWDIDAESLPREEFIMNQVSSIGILFTAVQYADMGSAEDAAQRAFEGLLREKVELTKRKLQAMKELEAMREEMRKATAHVNEFYLKVGGERRID